MMKHIGKYALYLLLTLSLGFNAYFIFSQQHDMTVIEVFDGDTLTILDGQKIRLIGLNAPESGLCGATESKNRLSQLIEGKSVRIEEGKYDQYNRRLALVYIGPTLVNEVLLKEGWARADYTPNSQSERLKSAYNDAVANNRGIHSSLCKSVSPTPTNPNCTIKSNVDKATGTRYYHLPKCRHYNQIVLDADLGEKFFCTEADAKAEGFTIAPDCLR